MENTPGAPVRSPYKTMVREIGDRLAREILAKPAAYTSPSGKQVYFLPDAINEAQVLATFYQASGPEVKPPRPGERGEPVSAREIKEIHDATLAAAKAISRISEGKARGRTIVLDDRFEAWRKESDSRGILANTNFRDLIYCYCEQTGERIERREESHRGSGELGLRGEVVKFPFPTHSTITIERPKRIPPASVAAYRQGYEDRMEEEADYPAEVIAERSLKASAAWAAKQEGR